MRSQAAGWPVLERSMAGAPPILRRVKLRPARLIAGTVSYALGGRVRDARI
jgi:hypothetical protein